MYKLVRIGLLTLVFLLASVFAVFAQSEKASSNSGKNENRGKSVQIEAKGNKLRITESEEEDETDDEDEEGDQDVVVVDDDEDANLEEEFEIEDEDGETLIKARGSANLVIRNKLAAQTKFPLRVNTDTNELIVITPKGEKIVTVLPDKAILNMLASKVLDEVGGKGGLLYREENPTATASAEPSPVATTSGETEEAQGIELTVDDSGDLVYKIEGFKAKKLLGFFNIKIKKIAVVSAETGEIVDVEQGFIDRILDFLSTPF